MKDLSFALFAGHQLAAADEAELRSVLELAVDFCLEQQFVFAMFDVGGVTCTLFLDTAGQLHVQSSAGDLVDDIAVYDHAAGITGNCLLAEWPARAATVAEWMANVFVDVADAEFPLEVAATILPTASVEGSVCRAGVADLFLRSADRFVTVGFVFGEDRSPADPVEGLADACVSDLPLTTIDEVKAYLLRLICALACARQVYELVEAPESAVYVVTLHADDWAYEKPFDPRGS